MESTFRHSAFKMDKAFVKFNLNIMQFVCFRFVKINSAVHVILRLPMLLEILCIFAKKNALSF